MSIRRQELGDFLATLRRKCDPVAFGFPAGSRRRTQGLRREEVAQLAAISPTWYAWIEQGRDINVSSDALERLAQALRMDRTQRAYLFELAGRRDPSPPAAEPALTEALLAQLLSRIAMPAYVLGRYWDVLAFNAEAAHLFVGWLDGAGPYNLLDYVFFHPGARTLVEDWEARARRLVAEFRADSRASLEEPGFEEFIARLSAGSAEFADYWRRHDVLERQGGLRGFHHPVHGRLLYQQVTFRLVDHDELKLVMLTPRAADDTPGF
ncbi:helix-turn-helix transcriptional regulator [Chitiniphilus purpureus]|uniref:Helix-turn-helix transcriptional regulator n=1 Tax=Chitiniphilus purpureus TaxID=2981137 RepID=A0ABY6DI57_9NEIS|nr:helix-turn-helix transcriptional regulator [Chitiniphilus sp. CD1]UXY14030.1 helix-turn-helix transcriptional regulator [Chitiniphilus sp. CD1]